MLQEIRERLAAMPFKPFEILMADGRKLQLASPDMAWIPGPGILHVWNPETDLSERVNPLLIGSIAGEPRWNVE